MINFKDFDPKSAYPGYPGMRVLDVKERMVELTVMCNLQTNMIVKGCTDDELARVVRYCLTVIDCIKYKLNTKQAYKENNISELFKKYGKEDF